MEVQQAFGFREDEVILASAKDGNGVSDILEAIVSRVPPPGGRGDTPLRALIFDSKYDSYKGVVAYVRVFDGSTASGGRIRVMASGSESEALEVGVFSPALEQVDVLSAGEVGYIATGLKSVGDAPVGDTITMARRPASEPLKGYQPLKPMVFAGLYPADGEDYLNLRDALEKLRLNDAALSFQPESSLALGTGFRCGFLGLLHMDVVQERLEREYDLSLLATSPSVAYRVVTSDGQDYEIDNPSKLPPAQQIDEIQEPWLELSIVCPANFIGVVMELVNSRRGEYRRMEYLQPEAASDGGQSTARVLIEYSVPLSEVLVDFYDQLKARTQGYASMDYSLEGYRPGNLVRLDILVNGEPVDALSAILHRDNGYRHGRDLVSRLKELIPRQLFEVPIQASIGSRVISRETIKALRKNVLAKCYGGDVTRKRKLLEKQAEGKRRMKRVGRVEIPQEAFLSILKIGPAWPEAPDAPGGPAGPCASSPHEIASIVNVRTATMFANKTTLMLQSLCLTLAGTPAISACFYVKGPRGSRPLALSGDTSPFSTHPIGAPTSFVWNPRSSSRPQVARHSFRRAVGRPQQEGHL